MSVQILGGRARGFSLQTPPDKITRPTAVLLRRRMFDWRQHWQGVNFLDLCAGSGAMGFEALSRGADQVWLNDSHRQAYQVLVRNLEKWKEKIGLEAQELRLSQFSALVFLQRWRAQTPVDIQQKTIVFFDPPYEQHALYEEFWSAIQSFTGEVWVESDESKGVSLASQRTRLIEVVKEVEQGSHWILVGRA